MSTINEVLDARGLNCPLPVMRTKKQLKQLEVGQCLKVLTSDPQSLQDMETLSKYSGMELVESSKVNGDYVFVVKKTG